MKSLVAYYIFLVIMTPILIFSCSDRDGDDTDNIVAGELLNRSGMRLFIDYGTGCEYLSHSYFVAMQPRLDKDGNHVCNRIYK